MSQIQFEFEDVAEEYFNYNLSLQKGLFIAFIIITLVIFFVIVQIIIWSLNTNILKSKRLLALYPLQQSSESLQELQETIAKLS